jgi:pilus assembly protein CpaD
MRTRLHAGTARAALSGTALVLIAMVAAGCTQTTAPPSAPLMSYVSEERHPILISDEPEVFEIPVGMSGPALSPEIETAIRQYVGGYRATGTGSITIQVPSGSANEVAAASTGRAVHYALVRAGVPRGRIQVAPYQVGDYSRPASLRLAYLKVKAVVPTCGIWPEKAATSFDNTQYQDFGCAQQQNLAAMIANPADLLLPEPMTPASGGRRADVIKTYVDLGNTGWQPEAEKKLLGTTTGGGF